MQKWNGKTFVSAPLIGLGLHVDLGHEDGSTCDMRVSDSHVLVVLHDNGIHEVSVRYCNCLVAIPRRRQLLRFGWYPATVYRPATCASIAGLELFHAATLTGKLSAYNFYKALVYMTDAKGLKVPKVTFSLVLILGSALINLVQRRYQPFLRMIRQYRHLLMLIRAGKGNVVNGATTIAPGELAMQCPACPIPGVNLPPDWSESSSP